MKKKNCDEKHVFYVSLEDIQNKKEYQIGLNTEVLGVDGKIHKVTHPGVAVHPGDKGMKKIAERIARIVVENN